MARHLRLEYAGAVYHVTARGNDRSAIFHTEEDRRHFLEVLAAMMERYAVVLHAYVLMNNHFHLVVRTLEPNLSRFMHDVNTGFSVWTNKRNRRTGHVFEGRFKAIAMQEEGYLRSVSAYVHLNPVRVRGWKGRAVEERLARVTEYPWSYPLPRSTAGNGRMSPGMRRSISAVRSAPSRWGKSAPCWGSRARP